MPKFVRGLCIAAMAFASVTPMAWSQDADFLREVAPLFQKHCVKCHGPLKQQGGIRFDFRSSALSKGDSGDLAIIPGRS